MSPLVAMWRSQAVRAELPARSQGPYALNYSPVLSTVRTIRPDTRRCRPARGRPAPHRACARPHVEVASLASVLPFRSIALIRVWLVGQARPMGKPPLSGRRGRAFRSCLELLVPHWRASERAPSRERAPRRSRGFGALRVVSWRLAGECSGKRCSAPSRWAIYRLDGSIKAG